MLALLFYKTQNTELCGLFLQRANDLTQKIRLFQKDNLFMR